MKDNSKCGYESEGERTLVHPEPLAGAVYFTCQSNQAIQQRHEEKPREDVTEPQQGRCVVRRYSCLLTYAQGIVVG